MGSSGLSYRTVFEVTSAGFLQLALPLLPLAVAALSWRFRRRPIWRAGALVVFVGGLLFSALSCVVLCINYARERNVVARYRNGQCETIAGRVSVKQRQPTSGHHPGDKIVVDGKTFVLDYFSSTVGYNKTVSHDGVLDEGADVRLTHCNNDIMKVEVRGKAKP